MTRSINLVFIILILSSFSLQAQSKKFEFGLNGGLVFRQVAPAKRIPRDGISLGFLAGLTTEYHLFDHGSIVLNPGFQRKGHTSSIESGPYGPRLKMTYDYNYVVLPMLFRKYEKKHYFFINAGPYIAFLASQRITYSANYDYPTTYINRTDFYRRVDFGLTAGFGAKIPIKEHFHFMAELQATRGISNVLKNEIFNGYFNDRTYMRMFTGNIILGMSYRL